MRSTVASTVLSAKMQGWLPVSQTCETGAGAKGKGIFSAMSWEDGGLLSQTPVPFLLKPLVLIGVRRKRFFFLSNYFESF